MSLIIFACAMSSLQFAYLRHWLAHKRPGQYSVAQETLISVLGSFETATDYKKFFVPQKLSANNVQSSFTFCSFF